MAADFADEEFVEEDENDCDIIIVGAGLTGLTCAYNILKKEIGLEVLILEANNEVGGRILSKNFSDTYHANFLQKRITNLLETLHINIEQKHSKSNENVLYTKGKPLQTLPRFYAAEVHSFLQTIEENTINFKLDNSTEDIKDIAKTSVEQLLRKIVSVPYARSLCRAYICSTCSIRNLNNVSALWFLVLLNGASGLFNRLKVMIGDSNRYFVQGGMIKIVQELLKNILRHHGEVRYAEPVNKIIVTDERVHVFTENNHYRCQFVVVAVSPLMQNRIIIEPSSRCLTNSLHASNENVFFNIVHKKSPWNDSPTKNIVTTWDSSNNLNIVYDASHGNTEEFVLAGFLTESNVIQTSKKGLFDTLNDCYKTTETLDYLQYKEYDESLINDQIKVGCPMSVVRPSSFDTYIECINSPYERIFFTSSEYATNWPGTIDGAIQAGENTATAILLRTRPQVLTPQELSRIRYTS
ncbi:Amine oxidase [flavin-containing] A [Anthophora retusa]